MSVKTSETLPPSTGAEAGTAIRREPRLAWLRQLMANPLGCFGLVLVVLIVFSAIGADLVATHDYKALDIKARLSGPTWDHLLGTDNLGRDTFSRSLYGGRVALTVALVSVDNCGHAVTTRARSCP